MELTDEDIILVRLSINNILHTGKNLLPTSQGDGERYFKVPLPDKGITVAVKCIIENNCIVSMKIV